MIVSEEEAKTKWCPFLRLACAGSGCMFWTPDQRRMLVNRHTKVVRELWAVDDNERHNWAEQWMLTPGSGSCGLRSRARAA
jgi:hypothetical protein